MIHTLSTRPLCFWKGFCVHKLKPVLRRFQRPLSNTLPRNKCQGHTSQIGSCPPGQASAPALRAPSEHSFYSKADNYSTLQPLQPEMPYCRNHHHPRDGLSSLVAYPSMHAEETKVSETNNLFNVLVSAGSNHS